MRIIFIGNYMPDRQESMIRFAQMLCSGFHQAGFVAEIWTPKVYFGKGQQTTNIGLGKWLGYIDKWLLFPLVLRRRIMKREFSSVNTHFHVCDHSNAPYLKHLPKVSSITCHDVIAIRGSMGYKDTYTSTSRFGKILQNWIFRYLRSASSIACDSQFTLNQLQELVKSQNVNRQNWVVIHNGFNANFKRYDLQEIKLLLSKTGLSPASPFILHVGSGHIRKNRKLLIEMVAVLGNKWTGKICFAGEAVEAELLAYADKLQLKERIISVVGPAHEVLTALYSSCTAFIFPSFSEGFGWPLIEAQACGAPVIASNIEPMPEISGGAALHAHPSDAHAFAEAFLSLQGSHLRETLIQKGYANCARFNLNKMVQSYIRLFEHSKSRS